MLAEGIELLLYILFVFHVRRKIETASIIAAAWSKQASSIFLRTFYKMRLIYCIDFQAVSCRYAAEVVL